MATKKSKATEGNSLAMFKAWLSGVEEMQGEDWTPNAQQWKRIKEKIMAIEEQVVEQPAPPPVRQFLPAPPQPYAPQQFAPAPVQQFAPMQSGFGDVQPSQKTPDIDSSNGYQSSLI